MMAKFKQGDRVVCEGLGAGVVVGESDIIPGWYEILFDKRPDVRYNMGCNPSTEPGKWLTKEVLR